MKFAARAVVLVTAFAAGAACAQPYRWVDDKGRVHYTDTPPPAAAKQVEKIRPVGAAASAQPPFQLTRVQKDFPVTLYTSPTCKEPCELARGALGKRGVPFKETQVWDEESNDQLKKVSGANEVPVLVVGRSVHRGFEQGAYDSLLDTAGYPQQGVLPVRAAKSPPPPDGWVPPSERDPLPTAEPVKPKPEAPAPKLGPYAPGAPPPGAQRK